ncbi:MAG: hypothetical protein AB7R90_04025 [Reyranellaceae bacterium]
MTVATALRAELNARRQVAQNLTEARERADLAAEKARRTLRLTVQMAAHAVNDELDHVPDAQAVARACLLKDDIDATCATVEQYLDDLLFQPLQLLACRTEDF